MTSFFATDKSEDESDEDNNFPSLNHTLLSPIAEQYNEPPVYMYPRDLINEDEIDDAAAVRVESSPLIQDDQGLSVTHDNNNNNNEEDR